MNIPLSRYWRLLSHYLRPEWPRVMLMAVLLIAGIGLQLAGPQIQRSFIDSAMAAGPIRPLVATALLFIATALATQVVTLADGYVAESVGWTATNALRADLALHCIRLDASFHNARTPGELIERIDGDVTVLANFFSRFVIYVVGNALLLAGVLVLLARENWLVGLASALFAGTVLVAMLRMYARARPIWVGVDQVQALFFGFLGEHLAGAEDIRSNGATAYVERRFSERLREWLPLYLRAVFAEQAVWMVALSLFAFAEAVALGLGIQLLRGGSVTVGGVYLIFRYVALLSRPVGQIQAQIQNFQQAGASIDRVQELLATRSRVEDGGGATLPHGPLAIEFAGVEFAYPRPAPPRGALAGPEAVENDGVRALAPALRDISLRIEPGDVVGVLGRTGSGKTSLARLLVRQYDPTAGTVRLGGTDVRRVALAHLRSRVGVVTQEVQLFQATVRDNLTFFDPSLADARLRSAIDELGLTRWLDALPMGLDTPLAGARRSLSAGEAQLLAFVRVFLTQPGVVVLDEASSRLDAATERLVEGAVDRLLYGKTGLVIAHRLGTVQRANQIVILEAGMIVECGRRVDLAADPRSRFSRLLRAAETGATGVLV